MSTFHKLFGFVHLKFQSETSKEKVRGEKKSKLLTCYLNWGEEVESQEQPEDHCAGGGPGLGPSSLRSPKREVSWRGAPAGPWASRHPRPPLTSFPPGTWPRDSNHKASWLQHFTQDIALFWWLQTFPLLQRQAFSSPWKRMLVTLWGLLRNILCGRKGIQTVKNGCWKPSRNFRVATQGVLKEE